MLKIKDSVDLKELEKFGFKENYSYTPLRDENGKTIRKPRKKSNGEYTKKLYTQYKRASKYYRYTNLWESDVWPYYYKTDYFIDEKDKIIEVSYDTNLDTINNVYCDLLYDLIKADLVEKVED